MNALDAVNWPGLFRHLLAAADAAQLERCAWYLDNPTSVGPGPAMFAYLVSTSDAEALRWTVADHATGASFTLPLDVTHWLRDQAHVLLGAVSSRAEPTSPPAARAPGQLHVAPSLAGLPLLPLAADLARHRGGLTVDARTLPPGIAGRYNRGLRLVVLDLDQGGAARWPHELAHALDPDLPRAGAVDLDERFADDLSTLLVEHKPSSIDDASPLIEQVRAGCRHQVLASKTRSGFERSSALPAQGAPSLAAFLDVARRATTPGGQVRS